ncbi:MAG TPA: NAD(P)H-dependent oxidoreductase [Planctomycetota bacterium]|nr:NAD(P)H-dependent oxidoreductase [Planctomycetota bacterium]
MPNLPAILAFAGTTRTDALNKKLIRVAAASAREAGADVTLIDLRDLPMPLYDGDLEAKEGIPPNAMKFKELMLAHRGLLISTGEYNSSITGVLKNAIDWASRSSPGEAELACFKDKVAGLVSASPGMLGGLRALFHVRQILGNIGVLVIPEQLALGRAHEAFEADGALKDPKRAAGVSKVAQALVRVVSKLS